MHCDCAQPGFCPRYGKEMLGRLHDICRGVNVDPGTAEQYRQIWLREAGKTTFPLLTKCPHLGEPVKLENGDNKKEKCELCGGVDRQVFACTHPALEPHETTMPGCQACEYRPRQTRGVKALILKNHLSPGDVLVMSAAIYSLHKAHPGKFATAVDTTANALFEHNPDVMRIEDARALDAEEIQMHYPAVNSCNERGITFMGAYCEFLSSVLNMPIPLLTNRPHVYLSKKERAWMDQVHEATGRKQKFWLIQCGRKNDFTAKFWGTENYQRVVDSLRGRVLFVQVGAAEHHHPPLKNVLNLTGKTDLRQLVRLCWHAQGVVCGVTMLQHLAAALEKPSVVILGGREPTTWYAYPRQQLLHTIGALPCCKSGGCWKSRVEKLNDGAEQDNSLCENPVIGEEVIPKCMALIRPSEVSEKILLHCS